MSSSLSTREARLRRHRRVRGKVSGTGRRTTIPVSRTSSVVSEATTGWATSRRAGAAALAATGAVCARTGAPNDSTIKPARHQAEEDRREVIRRVLSMTG